MNICFLVSGIPRTYYNNLHLFFIELYNIIKFDVYINFSDDNDTNYSNTSFDISLLNEFSFYKNIYVTSNTKFNKTKKSDNILNQWSRLQFLFKSIKKEYDIYIRIRPDSKILINKYDFIEIINNLNINQLHIPNGYDFHNSFELEKGSKQYCINDQIAIANKNIMNIYCNFFDHIKLKDKILYQY